MKFGLEVGCIGLFKTWFINRISLKIFSNFMNSNLFITIHRSSDLGFRFWRQVGNWIPTTFVLIFSLCLTIFLTKWIATCNNALRWSCLGLFTVAAKQINYTVLCDLKITYCITTIIKKILNVMFLIVWYNITLIKGQYGVP